MANETKRFSRCYQVFAVPKDFPESRLKSKNLEPSKELVRLFIYQSRISCCDGVDCVWNVEKCKEKVETLLFHICRTGVMLDYCFSCFQKTYPKCFKLKEICSNTYMLGSAEPVLISKFFQCNPTSPQSTISS
jgi:hypothetical protein